MEAVKVLIHQVYCALTMAKKIACGSIQLLEVTKMLLTYIHLLKLAKLLLNVE